MKIPEEILKGLTKKTFPDYPTGGQGVGKIYQGVTLSHQDLDFSISIGFYSSQLKNIELAMTFFELYYEEINK